MAEAGGFDLEHFAAPRRLELELLDRERPRLGERGGGVHGGKDSCPGAHDLRSRAGAGAHSAAEFVNEDADVVGVVDRDGEQVHAAGRERGFERGREVAVASTRAPVAP